MNEFGERMDWPVEIVLVFIGVTVIYEIGRFLLHVWHRFGRPTGAGEHGIWSGHRIA